MGGFVCAVKCTFPFKVVAANSVPSASALDWRIVRVVVQASFCKIISYLTISPLRGQRARKTVLTDFWNLPR